MRYCGCSVKNQVLEIAWLSLNRLSSSIFCCLSVSLLGTRNTQLNLHLFKYIQAYKPYFDPEEYLQVPTVITFWSIHWIFLWPIWWVTPSILRLVFLVLSSGWTTVSLLKIILLPSWPRINFRRQNTTCGGRQADRATSQYPGLPVTELVCNNGITESSESASAAMFPVRNEIKRA